MNPVTSPSSLRARRWASVLAGLSAVVWMLLVFGHASAAIELLYFRGSAETSRIKLEWQTATELNNAGFRVLRNTTGGTNPTTYTIIDVFDPVFNATVNFIPARGDNLAGASYTVFDENVTLGTRYYYYLQDIDNGNNSTYHGPVTIVGGQTATPNTNATPTTTATALIFPTATRTGTPTATRTPTELPPSTRRPTGTVTPLLSLTPSPTGTSTTVPVTNIPAVDLTLTAIAFELTSRADGTETVTPEATGSPTADVFEMPEIALDSAGQSDNPEQAGSGESTRAADSQANSQAPGSGESERPPLPAGRIVLLIVVLLLSGALLTGGVIFIVRRSEDESQQ